MNKVQELYLEQLKTVKFKQVSGEKIVADLLAHQELWRAVYPEFKWHIDNKENPTHFWDPWHLYVFTVPGKEDELRSLVETWDPIDADFTCENDHWSPMDEEPFFTSNQETLDNKKLYLSLWWDDVISPVPDGQPAHSQISMKEKVK